jgi:hypothetical protein
VRSLTTSLATWEPREAVERKDALNSILDSPGLDAIYAAIEARKADLTSQLLTRNPDDSASAYADAIGRLKSYEEFPLLIAGILEKGREAELALREETE